jgi:hypothetical protein
MKSRSILLALMFFGTLWGCDLVAKATANRVMVGSVLASPPVTFSPVAVAGFDAGSGVDAGTVTVDGQTAGLVFFGTREGDVAPDGIAGAAVTVGPSDGTKFTFDDLGGGSYAKSSVGGTGFTYVPGKSYEFTATQGGTAYIGSVEGSPPVETIAAFHPSAGYITHTVNQAFSFERGALGSGEERTLGFVTVVPVSNSGQKGTPTYSNIPTTPLEFLQMVVSPGAWKTQTVQVPASAFPTAATTYFVSLQSVKLGTAKSNNLFVGSALMAGSGDVGVLRVP